ncbi:hypothetical protein V6N13_148366 [Hibiscus sabdariffa]
MRASDAAGAWRYPTVGGASYQYTEVNSFDGSSSSYPSHDDEVYRPHFEYPQPSFYGQSMGVQAMTSLLSTTIISIPLFTPKVYSTPSSMQMMDDQLNEDGQTLDHPHRRKNGSSPSTVKSNFIPTSTRITKEEEGITSSLFRKH